MGEHQRHPGQAGGGAGVDAADAGVGVRAGEQGQVQGAREVEVAGEDGAAGDQGQAVHLALAGADHLELLAHSGASRISAAAARIASTGFT